MRRHVVVLGLLCTLGVSGGITAAVSSQAAPKDGDPKALAEALAVPHGVAAGDKVLERGKSQESNGNGQPVAGVAPENQGVNNGSRKQATGVRMRTIPRGQGDAGLGANKSAQTGGCVPGYSDGKSCLPIVPPSHGGHMDHAAADHPWTVSECRSLFASGIPLQVKGTDPLKLDTNDDGVACGTGD